jgi:tetratricopeptide (TPR) repeat protein
MSTTTDPSETLSPTIIQLKNEGNEYLKQGNVQGAIDKYSQALQEKPTSYTLLSNRSVARLRIGDVQGAIQDARLCIEVASNWGKGYGRLAAALKEDINSSPQEIDSIIKQGLLLDPENTQLKQLKHRIQHEHIVSLLQGKWHGRVSDEVGGYVQEFEFWSDSDVRVHVLNTSVDAKFALDVNAVPYPTLDLSVPSAPGSPIVRHIFRFNQDYSKLDLCSPYMTSPDNRPTEFSGPGFVEMYRGQKQVSKDVLEKIKSLGQLSEEERMIQFLKEILEIVPKFDTRPKEYESDTIMANKMSANVRFQSIYQQLTEIYGESVENHIKELLVGIRSENNEFPQVRDLIKQVREKMMFAGLMPYPDEEERTQRERDEMMKKGGSSGSGSTTNVGLSSSAASSSTTTTTSTTLNSGNNHQSTSSTVLDPKDNLPPNSESGKKSGTSTTNNNRSAITLSTPSSNSNNTIQIALLVTAVVVSVAGIWYWTTNKGNRRSD